MKIKLSLIYMSENIKIPKKDKQIFDMLQAELTSKTGKKITYQEFFSKIIEFTRYNKNNFFGRIHNLPLSEKEIEKLKGLRSDWGIVTDETKIDKIIY
jgi:predicted nucleic-acid-binding Zn-ribbon protein